jgi:hypothetical protein
MAAENPQRPVDMFLRKHGSRSAHGSFRITSLPGEVPGSVGEAAEV